MKKSIFILLLPLLGANLASAFDAITVEAGYGDRVGAVKAGLTKQWNKQWFTEGNWHLTGYWEANAGILKSDAPGGKTLVNVGVAPVFRLRPNASGGAQPYWEAAVGAQLYSSATLNNDRAIGSPLLLSELVGFGFTFGEKTRYDVGYRLQHASNAGLREPDNGLTLHQIRLTYLY